MLLQQRCNRADYSLYMANFARMAAIFFNLCKVARFWCDNSAQMQTPTLAL